MLNVLRIGEDGSALVDTHGLFRVVGGGEIIAELESRPVAESIAKGWHNGDPDNRFATVVSYADLVQSASRLSAIVTSSWIWFCM